MHAIVHEKTPTWPSALTVLSRHAFGDGIRRRVTSAMRNADVHGLDAGLFENLACAAAECD